MGFGARKTFCFRISQLHAHDLRFFKSHFFFCRRALTTHNDGTAVIIKWAPCPREHVPEHSELEKPRSARPLDWPHRTLISSGCGTYTQHVGFQTHFNKYFAFSSSQSRPQPPRGGLLAPSSRQPRSRRSLLYGPSHTWDFRHGHITASLRSLNTAPSGRGLPSPGTLPGCVSARGAGWCLPGSDPWLAVNPWASRALLRASRQRQVTGRFGSPGTGSQPRCRVLAARRSAI